MKGVIIRAHDTVNCWAQILGKISPTKRSTVPAQKPKNSVRTDSSHPKVSANPVAKLAAKTPMPVETALLEMSNVASTRWGLFSQIAKA